MSFCILVIVDDFAPLQFLRPGEQLLWQGKPDPAVWFTPADLYVMPISVLWCGFAIIWDVGVSREGGPLARIWGIPFVAVGLYFVFGRFLRKRYQKRRTVYAITTQRALVVTGGRELADAPWGQRAVSVRRSRDARHASVILDGGGTRVSSRQVHRPRPGILPRGLPCPEHLGDARGQKGGQAGQPLLFQRHVLGPARHQRQPNDHVLAQPVHGIDRAAGRPPAHRQPRPLRELAGDQPPDEVIVNGVHTRMHLPCAHDM